MGDLLSPASPVTTIHAQKAVKQLIRKGRLEITKENNTCT